jgi:flagellar basal body rod protein FlgC
MQISLSGLNSARAALDLHAHNIANVSSENVDVDLAEETVGVITSKAAFEANLQMLRTQAETDRSLIDILA